VTPFGQNNHHKWCLEPWIGGSIQSQPILSFHAPSRAPRRFCPSFHAPLQLLHAPPRQLDKKRLPVHLIDPPTTVRSPPNTPPSESAHVGGSSCTWDSHAPRAAISSTRVIHAPGSSTASQLPPVLQKDHHVSPSPFPHVKSPSTLSELSFLLTFDFFNADH
jgi:hypothetical protein